MKNFWIIDGSSLVHREYFSSIPLEMRDAKTPEEKEAEEWRLMQINGMYTNALNGFFTQLEAIITYQKVDYLAVCFDKSRLTTFRRDLYPEYKAQRTPTPSPLKQQMQTAHDLCERIGIQTYWADEYEADDFAGSLAKKFASDNVKIHLVTTDRDYLQLLDKNIDCHMMITSKTRMDQLVNRYGETSGPIGTYLFDEDVCLSELGIFPYQVTDWKGLSGDPSDNIPGIKGVSDRSVIPLLNKYGSIDGIYQFLSTHTNEEAKEQWKSLGISRVPIDAIRKGEETARFFKDLATIKTDIPIYRDLRDFSNLPKRQEFQNIADEYGLLALDDLIERINEKEKVWLLTHKDNRQPDYRSQRSNEPDNDKRLNFSFGSAPSLSPTEAPSLNPSFAHSIYEAEHNSRVENSNYDNDEDMEQDMDDEYGEDFDMWA